MSKVTSLFAVCSLAKKKTHKSYGTWNIETLTVMFEVGSLYSSLQIEISGLRKLNAFLWNKMLIAARSCVFYQRDFPAEQWTWT